MSTFNNVLDMIEEGNFLDDYIIPEHSIPGIPFNIKKFSDEVRENSATKNRLYSELSNFMNAYDIADNCILSIIKRIKNFPLESFAHQWLPILLRAMIGKSVHEFIQSNTSQFTETEASLKIPSIRFSGRLDGLISYNILNEIKSCTYEDYIKIVKSRKPRPADFYQAMTYKYIIENYLDEAKRQKLKSDDNPEGIRTPPPRLDKYNIEIIQFIYVAHNILSDDVEDLSRCLENIKILKKSLNSKSDHFYFITSITLKISDFDTTPYIDYITRKIKIINEFIDNNKLPTKDNEFIDMKKCHFCLYKDDCQIRK